MLHSAARSLSLLTSELGRALHSAARIADRSQVCHRRLHHQLIAPDEDGKLDGGKEEDLADDDDENILQIWYPMIICWIILHEVDGRDML